MSSNSRRPQCRYKCRKGVEGMAGWWHREDLQQDLILDMAFRRVVILLAQQALKGKVVVVVGLLSL